MDDEIRSLIARLLAQRWLERSDPSVRKALTDEMFRQELDHRLSACGLKFLDNPYSEYVGTALLQQVEEGVFSSGGKWLSNNFGLARDGTALLVVLWALLILPKRQRQIEAGEKRASSVGEPLTTSELRVNPKGELPQSSCVNISALRSDFGSKLGGKVRLNNNLSLLSRMGLIIRKDNHIYEGPLLDLALDYSQLAGRIFDGAMSSIIACPDQRNGALQNVSV